ncbi:MAG: C-GCAxxG-C-C family protein [Proteobacteria bacterium]|nr:C-GCAxxG-C-C family protein [Pseudomonadota bacterium]
MNLRENTADIVAARAEELFKSGLFCAESVLLAVAESQQIRNKLIPRIATGFCSGVARTGGQCGAVSGAILAISMLCGRDSNATPVESNYRIVRSFIGKFKKAFGDTNCFSLLGCPLDTPEGQAWYKENNLLEKCVAFTREAGRLAISTLQEADESAEEPPSRPVLPEKGEETEIL